MDCNDNRQNEYPDDKDRSSLIMFGIFMAVFFVIIIMPILICLHAVIKFIEH